MKVCFCSAFRNAEHYIQRYFYQIQQYADFMTDPYLVCAFGDSLDYTSYYLQEYLKPYQHRLIEVNHGGSEHGSVVHPVRFKNLAFVWNNIWNQIPDGMDAVVFLEADLKWTSKAMIGLIGDLLTFEVVSPMIQYDGNRYPKSRFHDVWAFRIEGRNFNPFPPYYPDQRNGVFRDIDCSGSCVAMRGEFSKGLQFNEEDLIIGICNQLKSRGARITLDSSIVFEHP